MTNDLNLTKYHSKYYSNNLLLKSDNKLNNLSKSMFDAKIDINPHQVEAALFAFKSPFQKGVILADEVGLGKTIEAGLILCQYWLEKKRDLLIISPSSLRKQWQNELLDKFNIESEIFETKLYKKYQKEGNINPFSTNKVVIMSYYFANRMREDIKLINWDLVIIDEAHKLRNVYKSKNKTSKGIRWAIEDCKKVLLTATPIQNNLMELYGLSTIIDEHIFGEPKLFKEKYIKKSNIAELKERTETFLRRTLRKDVTAYINYTKRYTITRRFKASDDEQKLYDKITTFIDRENSFSIPSRQRTLITLVIRKLLSSSVRSVTATFEKILKRLLQLEQNSFFDDTNYLNDIISDEDFSLNIEEEIEEFEFEMGVKKKEELKEKTLNKILLKQEIKEIKEIISFAEGLKDDTKAFELLNALTDGFNELKKVNANKKALIFTENKKTQAFIKEFLEKNGFDSKKIVIFNGSNNSKETTHIYNEWLKKSKNKSNSKSANVRMALIDYFKDEAEIMIATEAGAEGVNMQFASMVINYDLPWNPQRIEQRIGRCHRYGQKNDVIVINFLNERNLADIRTYELLESKFNLFNGVLGISDEILGIIETGSDFERKILNIYNSCRTHNEIEKAFDNLRKEMETVIQNRLKETHKKIIDNFDEGVHDRLKMSEIETRKSINNIEKIFWRLTNYELNNFASFNDDYIFELKDNINNFEKGHYELITKHKERKIEKYIPYKMNSGLGEYLIKQSISRKVEKAFISFDISNRKKKLSIIENKKGSKGTLILSKFKIDGLEYQEYLLFNGYIIDKDKKIALDDEFCEALFKCDGYSNNNLLFDYDNLLLEDSKLHSEAILNQFIEKNDKDFIEQEDKLYKWADDLEKSKELELDITKNQIKKLQREVRKAINMQEKERLTKEIKKLEKLKRKQRENIFKATDEIEEKRDQLLDLLQNRKKYKTELEKLFIIDFEIV